MKTETGGAGQENLFDPDSGRASLAIGIPGRGMEEEGGGRERERETERAGSREFLLRFANFRNFLPDKILFLFGNDFDSSWKGMFPGRRRIRLN